MIKTVYSFIFYPPYAPGPRYRRWRQSSPPLFALRADAYGATWLRTAGEINLDSKARLLWSLFHREPPAPLPSFTQAVSHLAQVILPEWTKPNSKTYKSSPRDLLFRGVVKRSWAGGCAGAGSAVVTSCHPFCCQYPVTWQGNVREGLSRGSWLTVMCAILGLWQMLRRQLPGGYCTGIVGGYDCPSASICYSNPQYEQVLADK